jgi:hypothetical protein
MAVKPTPAELFPEVRALLLPYANKFTVKGDSEKGYALYSVGEFLVFGRIFPEVFFASVQPMKGHLGFYFFPIYTHHNEFKLDPELKKMLKGKSCFHVKEMNPELKKKLEALLKQGFELYKKCGMLQ